MKQAPVIEKETLKEQYVVNQGHEMTFTVPYKGSPKPTVQWFFKGYPIKTEGSDKVSLSNFFLSFYLFYIHLKWLLICHNKY